MKWHEIELEIDNEYVEEACGIFYTYDIQGVNIIDPEDMLKYLNSNKSDWDYYDIDDFEKVTEGKAIIKGYLHESMDIEELKKDFQQKLDFAFNDVETKVCVGEVVDKDWNEGWKKHFKPVKIGKKIVIKPSWEEYEAVDDEIIVEMDPGMAFGTGTHETTSLCVDLLQEYIKDNTTVFDVGCGTAILSIVAAKLGANRVLGIDIDPVAYRVSKENVDINNVEDIVEIRQGDLLESVDTKGDLIVANIMADVIIMLSSSIGEVMKDDAIFIASGIIIEKLDEVLDTLENNGFQIIEVKKDGGWSAIVCKR